MFTHFTLARATAPRPIPHGRWGSNSLPLALAVAGFLLTALPGLAAPRITEFMADNETSLADVDGRFSDWIEIHNPDATPISLAGYYLTDNATNLTKWAFPAVTLDAGAYLVVFASGKDRASPTAQLHTNFQLEVNGGYLALVAPNGTEVLSVFPDYPPQYQDESYGYTTPGAVGTVSIAPVWASPANYANVSITAPGVGLTTNTADNLNRGISGGTAQAYIWFDLSSGLANIPTGATVLSGTMKWRGTSSSTVSGTATVPSKIGLFPVPDTNKGIPTVATGTTGTEMLTYYAANTPVAEVTITPATTPVDVTFDISAKLTEWLNNPTAPQRGQLMMLNSARPHLMRWTRSATAAPVPLMTLEASVRTSTTAPVALNYFAAESPGAGNAIGKTVGPHLKAFTKDPAQPVTGPLTITTKAIATNAPVQSVTLFYRRMYQAETSLAMNDAGTDGDVTAADGIYTAVIPATAIVPGEMTRWRFRALDTNGVETKEPSFRIADNSPEYHGTVGHDPTIITKLPVLHWFTNSAASAGEVAGARCSILYGGEFYDNIYFNRHGQSSAGFPKRSFNIDFNRGQRFRWNPDAPRIPDVNLLTNWADKSKARHVLGYEVMREAGVPAHFAYTVRVEQNGDFFSTADFVEDANDVYLERAGLNPDGALYKIYSYNINAGDNPVSPNVEKKNRKTENNADLTALQAGLNLAGVPGTNYVYDNLDIPKLVNFFAANSVIRNIDMHSKNWYLYRDTGRSDRWTILPWDLDLSQGRVWNEANTYYDNAIYLDSYLQTGSSRITSIMFGNAATSAMIYRRIRTLTDRFLQPASTPVANRWYERRLDEISAQIDPPDIVPSDAQKDFVKWGSWLQRGATVPYTNTDPAVETMAEAILRFKNEYLVGRRNWVYGQTQEVLTSGLLPRPQNQIIPVAWTTLVAERSPCKVKVPTSSTEPGINWIGLAEPFDDSTWRTGTAGVGYEKQTGYESHIGLDVSTEMAAFRSIYIRFEFNMADPTVFDTFQLRMKYDDGYAAFINGTPVGSVSAPGSIQWNSSATSAREADLANWSTLDLTRHKARFKAGRNVLSIQGLNASFTSTTDNDFLIYPELRAGISSPPIIENPKLAFGTIEHSPASGNQDQEFIVLRNPNATAMDISNWELRGGVEHTFEPGTVLPANGGTIYVTPNFAAFKARTVSPKGGEGLLVQEGISGHLSSFGETISLYDDVGVLNISTSYVGTPSDAQKYLVVSEVMYRPDGDGMAEFVEILNTSSTVTVSLTGVKLTNGVDFDFTGSAITSLAPGARALVVRDQAAFTAKYGAALPVAGVFANLTALSNGGELVKLEDGLNGTIREFTYDDINPWPTAGDGVGYSIVLINPMAGPEHNNPANWRSSTQLGGNPGTSDAVAAPANPTGDANQNGLADIIDYAMGNGLGTGPVRPVLTRAAHTIGNQTYDLPLITYPVALAADGAVLTPAVSTDLATWPDTANLIETVSVTNQGDGRALVTIRVLPPMGEASRVYFRLNAAARP